MHELSRVKSLINSLVSLYELGSSGHFVIGYSPYSMIDIEEVKEIFTMISKEEELPFTVTFHQVEQILQCKKCETRYDYNDIQLSCSECGSTQLNLDQPDKLIILSSE